MDNIIDRTFQAANISMNMLSRAMEYRKMLQRMSEKRIFKKRNRRPMKKAKKKAIYLNMLMLVITYSAQYQAIVNAPDCNSEFESGCVTNHN